MSEQSEETPFSTNDHQTVINSSGVVFVEAPNERGWCVRMQPKDAIAHALYVLSRRAELEQLQDHLDATWKAVALEVKERYEQQERELFSEASANEIQAILESVSGTDKRGFFATEPTSSAGRWYRAMWNEDGSTTTTYEQQWTPFLCICYQLQQQSQG